MNINEARLVSFVTNLYGDWFEGDDLEKLCELIKNCYQQVPVEAERTKVDLKPLFDYMLNNRKIDAIKEYRQLTGKCLKYAYADVTDFMDRIKGE